MFQVVNDLCFANQSLLKLIALHPEAAAVYFLFVSD